MNPPPRRPWPLFVTLVSTLLILPTLGPGALTASPTHAPSSTTNAPEPTAIITRPNPSSLEQLAAREIQRYVYLRTDRLLPIKSRSTRGHPIVVTRYHPPLCQNLGQDLAAQQFTLRTTADPHRTTWWIVGGDNLGTLYGAYRFAETLGVRFGPDEDSIPDQPLAKPWPQPNETAKPRFALRGLQPFHDFAVGPDWWNLPDYQNVLNQMAKLRLNFIGFHTYPSWNPATGPEANVWIGLPEDVDSQGNVRHAYQAGVVTTRRGWAVHPFPTRQYASGAHLLFSADDYGPDFMLDCLDWPSTTEAATAMFNRYGDLQQAAFVHARRLAIKTCVGTELPLGVPDALKAHLQTLGLHPEDPAVIQRLYEGTFLRLMRKTPVDYFWLWTPEIWLGAEPGCPGWEITSRTNVERDLRLADAAAHSVQAPFGMATGGWRLGTRDNPLWLHHRTRTSWAASSINTSLGRDPIDPAYRDMPGRPRWAIGWAEDDDTAGAHCCTCWDLQFWAGRMFTHSSQAFDAGLDGMMAIHWRTAAIAPNLMALSQAGWEITPPTSPSPTLTTSPPLNARIDAFWADWGRDLFGGDAGAQAGRLFQRFDGAHLPINALIAGGANTTDAQIAETFAPLSNLEALRPQITGLANLERFDYWLHQVRASQLRVQTWVRAARLGHLLQHAGTLSPPPAQADFARNTLLPLRLNIARDYEQLIATLVHAAKSPGELGTISSIESGRRTAIVHAHDAALATLLGQPLPPETQLNTAYRGAPRIFVSGRGTLLPVGQPQALRAFVLSQAKPIQVQLHWRTLGQRTFRKTAAIHEARHAYHVPLPTHAARTLEYFLEATLANGQSVLWPATAPTQSQTVIVW